jgi:hypothetical protein
MGQGQRNAGVVNLRQIGRVHYKSFSELLAEVEARKG